MRILTDCKQRASELIATSTPWMACDPLGLDKAERELWPVLTESSPLWVAERRAGKSSSFWHRLIIIGEAARSQFDALHEAVGQGLSLDGPTAVMALDGRNFHGQRGRPWSIVKGNLFLTVVLPVGAPAASLTPQLIMLPTVSLVDAIHDCGRGGVRPTIKWVNDILIHGRKVAGVLTASLCRNGSLEAAVLGLGVNVGHAPHIDPTPFVPAAGCLVEEGVDVTLSRFLWCLLERLTTRCQAFLDGGSPTLLDAYRQASCVVGHRVRVWDDSSDRVDPVNTAPLPFASGVVRSIEDDLSLRIDGHEAPVTKGRVAFEESCVALGL